MQTLPLRASDTATADATGRAEARIGPRVFGEAWSIQRTSLQNDGVSTPRADLYLGEPATPSAYVEGTNSGSSDVTDTLIPLLTLETLTVVWTGAEPGSSCTVVVSGNRMVDR